jgi:hypothetical protein
MIFTSFDLLYWGGDFAGSAYIQNSGLLVLFELLWLPGVAALILLPIYALVLWIRSGFIANWKLLIALIVSLTIVLSRFLFLP